MRHTKLNQKKTPLPTEFVLAKFAIWVDFDMV